MKVRRIQLAVLLALGIDASAALAQAVPVSASSIADGASNTLLISDQPGLSVGNTPGAGSAPNLAPDLVGRGSVTTNGSLSGSVNQIAENPSDSRLNRQLVAIGDIANSSGDQIVTNGAVGGVVTQSLTGTSFSDRSQRVAVGSIDDSTLGTATTNGLVLAGVNQTSSAKQGQQSVEIGSVRSSNNLASLTTFGVAGGDITQSNAGASEQGIDIGSVASTSGNRVSTDALVTGRLSQIQGQQVSVLFTQNIRVGAVLDSQLGTASTRATVSGDITQQLTGTNGAAAQTVSVGSINDVQAGIASTDATVTGRIDQTASANRFSTVQRVSIGSIEGARGANLVTKAVVSGNISQTADNFSGSQTVSVASVLGRR